jgi:hypothetical protein
MIDSTLATLETWYNEPTAGPERPKLLSKLALLELCGWLETEQDRILLAVDSACLKDSSWTQKEIVEKTFGFDYNKHFRPMMVKLIGEHLMRKLVDQLKASTSDLWTKRCNFAHADMAFNIAKQQRFDAPSWSSNRLRILNKALARFEAEAVALAAKL